VTGIDENGVETMGLFDRIKETISTATSGPSPEVLASLSPAQRAKYDARMAEVGAAQGQAAQAKAETDAAHDARVAQRPLRGPAGEWVHGASEPVGPSPEQLATMTPAEMKSWTASQSKSQLKDLLTNPLGGTKPPLAPTTPTSGSVDRQEQAGAERATRDSARRPYLAGHRATVVFTRLATRGKTQIEELTAYLASSGLADRPDLVFGVYRVPDRISPALGGSEDARVVEWDIVHAPSAPLAPASIPAMATFFDGQQRWVERRVGEPSVLDEDLGVAALAAAGVGPEETLGIARHLTARRYGQGEDGPNDLISHVTGMHVFRPGSPGADVFEQLPRPIDLPAHGCPGVHVEALNWGAVARAVHPRPHHAYTIPSPFPYLPSTAQELIRMYIEVVGLQPNDCYATSVTEDGVRSLGGQEWLAGGLIEWSTTFGDLLPCADGKDRRRVAGGSLVMLAYRDRPEYETGRDRWDAYQTDVLEASLQNGIERHRPVEPPALDGVPGGLRQLIRVAEKVDRVASTDAARDLLTDLVPHRYCSPPIE
jgi:hypothetical protein